MEKLGSPGSVNTEEDNLEFSGIQQEHNLTGTEIGDVVLLPPHDFLALNDEEIFDLFTIGLKNHMGYCAHFIITFLSRLVKYHSLIAPHDP